LPGGNADNVHEAARRRRNARQEGHHTLRLLKDEGKLLFSEIIWLPGH
jgi:hypothetical protein